MHRNLEIIINTSELTAGTRGASLGPGAIMTAARKHNNSFFGKIPLHPLPDFNHYIDQPTATIFAKRIDGFSRVFHSVADTVSTLLSKAITPVVLAGDHGSAAGTIAGIKAQFPDKRLGVIWIDAHGDLHSPYTTPSGNMHGMPLAICLGENNISQSRNDLDAHTIEAWDGLKQAYGIFPKIKPEDLVFIAVRDTEPEEDHLINTLHLTNHTVEDVRKSGVPAIVENCLNQLQDCDLLYISFDVDSMDPQLTSFGTGTPVGNGLTPEEATEILTLLAQDQRTVCVEFVEVNPCLDNKCNAMAEYAFEILEKVTNVLTSK